MSKLKEQLEKWKSHNEVHARPADHMLYELFSDLLKKIEGDEQLPAPSLPEAQEATSGDNAELDPPGGNNPDAPNIP